MSEFPLDQPADVDVTRLSASSAMPSRSIGPYRLLNQLGEAGMGEVWLAERAAPIRRQVAIKLIKTGMDMALCLSHPGMLGIRFRAQDGSVVTALSPVPRPNGRGIQCAVLRVVVVAVLQRTAIVRARRADDDAFVLLSQEPLRILVAEAHENGPIPPGSASRQVY